jgi:hypothetical protein
MRVGPILHAPDLLSVPAMRPAIVSGDKQARIEKNLYAGLSRDELHKIAAEKVRFYKRRQRLGEPFHHLLDAWRGVEKRQRGKQGASVQNPEGEN